MPQERSGKINVAYIYVQCTYNQEYITTDWEVQARLFFSKRQSVPANEPQEQTQFSSGGGYFKVLGVVNNRI